MKHQTSQNICFANLKRAESGLSAIAKSISIADFSDALGVPCRPHCQGAFTSHRHHAQQATRRPDLIVGVQFTDDVPPKHSAAYITQSSTTFDNTSRPRERVDTYCTLSSRRPSTFGLRSDLNTPQCGSTGNVCFHGTSNASKYTNRIPALVSIS